MSQLDLGRVTLRIPDSQLQLHLTAAVRFSRSQKRDTTRTRENITQFSHLVGNWITEAPDMELRFFIGRDWALRSAVDTLITRLKDKICGLKIWTELGFSAVLHTEDDKATDVSEAPNLRVGLHRKLQRHDHSSRRTLPISMANPPDVCPPEGIIRVNLVSVDITMEFCFHDAQMSQVKRLFDPERSFIQLEPPDIGLRSNPEATADLTVPFSMPEDPWPKELHQDMLFRDLRAQVPHTFADRSGPSIGELFQLFELGIQKLIVLSATKAPTTRASKENTIISLPDIAPAIFKAGYREAINQRGVAIPIIAKAISSMLKGDRDFFEGRMADLSHIAQRTNFFAKNPHATDLKNEVRSRLWHIAQARTSPSRPLKRKSIMMFTTFFTKEIDIPGSLIYPMPTHQPHGYGIFSNTDTNIQTEQREGDNDKFASLLNESGCQSESEDQILDNDSETSFIDLGDSTQTSLDTLLSTAASSQITCNDDESMLFSDFVDVADGAEEIVRYPYPLERVVDHDADIIMYEV